MSKRRLIIVVIIFFAVLSTTGWTIGNPVGPGTVPPSSYSSGLVRTPNPIDTSSNLVITGNVRGGRHFQGVVPYQSTTDFRATTPSSSFDSFLRRSAGSEGLGRFSRKPAPYYSPTRTVTSVRPGRTDIFRPPARRYNIYGGRTTGFGTVEALLPRQYQRTGAIRPDTVLTGVSVRPMSRTANQLEKILSTQLSRYPYITKPSPNGDIDKKRTVQMEQLQRDLKPVSNKADRSRYDRNLLPAAKDKVRPDLSQLPQSERIQKTQTAKEPATKDELFDIYEEIDVYEQMKRRLDNFQKTYESSHTGTKRKVRETSVADDYEEEKQKDKSKSGSQISSSVATRGAPGAGSFQTGSIPPDKSPASVKTGNIPTSHRTFASSIKDEFNEHIRIAENYLKEGKYYKAADAYTLASIYKPSDPLTYAGKSHALFAAGEYMSSALFLYKTLDMFPEYARLKIDIVSMVGDRDAIETRIADIERQVKKIDAPELHFLLGYVYYRIDRLREAQKAIDTAYKKMYTAPAVIALKEAIDNAAK
ncbi:MAG: hypothetical protein ACYS1A_03780 [Planctomycetota bacterium]|jgi:tetratricopeptide (TPR) repeat protein